MTDLAKPPFSPLCDLHHTPMEHMMIEEDSEQVRSYHRCMRRDCSRVFRESNGYSDLIEGEFDDSRVSEDTCPQCGAVLYLAEVDSQKVETWECARSCGFSQDHPAPAGR